MTIHYLKPVQIFLLGIVLWLCVVRAEEIPSTVPAAAVDTIAGPLPKIVKAQEKPYYVVADLEVPADQVVTIEPGVVFVFRNFTGLHVSGKLIAQGTKAKPIIFTSENDKTCNPATTLMPNPYDWNGIYIHDDAFGSILSYCTVSYTVYGIISDTKFIKLDPVTFLDNGKSSLIIEGKEQIVTSEPYHYTLSTKDATKDGVPINLLKDPKAVKRNILRYTGLAAAVGGIGVGVYYATEFRNSWNDWEEINAPNPSKEILQKDPGYYVITKKQKNKDLARMCIGVGAGLLGAVGFSWSFTF